MAEFEFHRILCEALQNPFLRAASPLVEFGIVQAVLPRIKAQVQDFALEKSDVYSGIAEGLATGQVAAATAAMAELLAIDRRWILRA